MGGIESRIIRWFKNKETTAPGLRTWSPTALCGFLISNKMEKDKWNGGNQIAHY